MFDVQECKLPRTKTTTRLKNVLELMAEGMSVSNSHSASDPFKRSPEVYSINSIPSERRAEAHSLSSHSLPSMVKRGRTDKGPSQEVVVEGTRFPGALKRSDPIDETSLYFPNPKILLSLKILG